MADQPENELEEAARLFTGWFERARLREIALRYFWFWAATFPDKTVMDEEGFARVPLARVWPEFWSHEFVFHAHAPAPYVRTRLGLYGPEGMGSPLVGDLAMDSQLDGTVCEAVVLGLDGEETTYSGGLLTADPAEAGFPKMLWPPPVDKADGDSDPGAS